jgi:hypothetical protein
LFILLFGSWASFILMNFMFWLLCFVRGFHFNNVFLDQVPIFLCSFFVIFFYYVVYRLLYLFNIASFQNPHVHLEFLKVHFILELDFFVFHQICFTTMDMHLVHFFFPFLFPCFFLLPFIFLEFYLLSFVSFCLFIGIYVNWVMMFAN